jgi:hypothetical protein
MCLVMVKLVPIMLVFFSPLGAVNFALRFPTFLDFFASDKFFLTAIVITSTKCGAYCVPFESSMKTRYLQALVRFDLGHRLKINHQQVRN